MSNRANKTQSKGKSYASNISGFDSNGFARRSVSSGSFGRTKHPKTVTATYRELEQMGLKRTGKVVLKSKLGNTIPLKSE